MTSSIYEHLKCFGNFLLIKRVVRPCYRNISVYPHLSLFSLSHAQTHTHTYTYTHIYMMGAGDYYKRLKLFLKMPLHWLHLATADIRESLYEWGWRSPLRVIIKNICFSISYGFLGWRITSTCCICSLRVKFKTLNQHVSPYTGISSFNFFIL